MMTTKKLIVTLFVLQCGLYTIMCSALIVDIQPHILEKDTEINAGANLTLRCHCIHRITWRHFNKSVLNKEEIGNIIDGEIFEKTLRLTNVSARDTGYYYCMLSQTQSGLNFDQDLEYATELGEASKIYVYVNDPTSLLVPSTSQTIVGKLYSKLVVPCKPSSKSTKVELLHNVTDLKPKYDERVGYTFRLTHASLNRSIFLCKPKISKKSNSSIEFNIIVEPYENFINTPVLLISQKFLTVGDKLKVTCAVVLKKTDIFDISWLLPNSYNSDQQEINNSIKDYINSDVFIVGQSDLIITDVTLEKNRGLYTCVVKNKDNNLSSNRSTFVNIWYKSKPLIIGQKDYYIKKGENVTAGCLCQAYPQCKIKWFYTQCAVKDAMCCAGMDYNEKLLNPITRFDREMTIDLNSTVTFQPEGPGVIRCEAQNLLGIHSVRSQLWIDDIDASFVIDQTNLTKPVSIGDSFTLTCAATLYNHSNVNWYRNSQLLQTDDEHEVVQNNTEYSTRKLLTVKNIKESAIYECSTNLTSTSTSTLYSVYTGFTDRLLVPIKIEKP